MQKILPNIMLHALVIGTGQVCLHQFFIRELLKALP
jgi:hypothetical protein